MKTALWTVQIALALVFLVAGGFELLAPIAGLEKIMGWVADVPAWSVRAAGLLQIIGAVGLVLPTALRTAPVLTPLASIGLALVMLSASALHGARGEVWGMGLNMIVFLMAVFVAWGRMRATEEPEEETDEEKLVTRPQRRVYTRTSW